MMFVSVWLFAVTAAALQALPPFPSTNDSTASFELASVATTIYITRDIAGHRDESGLTLIPPSGEEFAATFIQELSNATSQQWSLELIDELPADGAGVYLTKFVGEDDTNLAYENGTPTEEAYQLEVTTNRIAISGSGSRGLWWGTRTVLQQLYLSNFTSIPTQSGIDAPAYATRGYMLDSGRKYYSASFLKDLCTYASFFKMSEFHYHISDNYPLNRGHNETWQDVYSHFSLRPEDPELLQGLVDRVNETLTRQEYSDLEQHCANYGIAVIPEIEAPGHALAITKWKPELALPKRDLLNLSHPESIPTVKRIWDEFLPWFNVKEVHIGADEYNASLADVYVGFVNEMAEYIKTNTNKSVRAWGTPFDQPSDEDIRISPDVIIQHWQHGQSDPLQLEEQGHQIINSEDWWAYTSIKSDHSPILPARYPQFFNNTRILNFGDVDGWQWDPSLFNQVNHTDQISPNSTQNKGAIMASWNDNGADASTQLEAYYVWRRGIPIVAARAWSGARGPKLDAATIDQSIDFLSARAPGQNLDRMLTPPSDAPSSSNSSAPIFTWTAPTTSTPNNNSDDSTPTHLRHGSKGLNHTLLLQYTGPFTLSSPDVTLTLNPTGKLIYTSDGTPYPLRSIASPTAADDPGHPGRIWWNVTSSSHEEVVLPLSDDDNDTSEGHNIVITTTAEGGSKVWVDWEWRGRFEVFVFGGRNTVFSWNQMAFVAPLGEVGGGSGLRGVRVWDGERGVEDVMAWKEGGGGGEGQGTPGTYTPGNGTWRVGVGVEKVWVLMAVVGVVGFVLVV